MLSHYSYMVILFIIAYCSFQYPAMCNQGDDDGSSFTSVSEVIIESIPQII